MTNRKTKIICTIGPASESEEVLTGLVQAGMDVMRLNFSHGSHEEHEAKIRRIHEINKKLGTNVAVLLDTKGPEIRTGEFENGVTAFTEGQKCVITQEDIVGTSDRFTITYKELYKDVKPGKNILVNDGQISLRVDEIDGTDICCTSMNSGEVKNRRGINVPGIVLNFDFISEKDRSDIIFGCEQDVSFIAASFTRRKKDILDIRRILVDQEKQNIQVIAKIENVEGVENIDEIIDVADGIMVARGDLGVEVPAEEVPFIQKMIIDKCNAAGKVVITATQMLESMQVNPRPTRAEVSDVANAIYDGTDAIMLSGESAAGKYPVESVSMMAKIALETENRLDWKHLFEKAVDTTPEENFSEAICVSAAEIAQKFNVAGIISFTKTGFTAMKMSRYRPQAKVIAATESKEVMRKLALNWGVIPYLSKEMLTRADFLNLSHIIAKENGIKAGETIIIIGGTPGVAGHTNYIEIVKVK